MRAGVRLADGRTTSAVPTIGDRARAVRVAWALVRCGRLRRPGRGERFGTEWVPQPGDAHRLRVSVYVTDAETRSTVEERAEVWFEYGSGGDVFGRQRPSGSRPRLGWWEHHRDAGWSTNEQRGAWRPNIRLGHEQH